MAQSTLTLRVCKRWFFRPAVMIMVLLWRVGLLRNQRKASKWLADHAVRIEVA